MSVSLGIYMRQFCSVSLYVRFCLILAKRLIIYSVIMFFAKIPQAVDLIHLFIACSR